MDRQAILDRLSPSDLFKNSPEAYRKSVERYIPEYCNIDYVVFLYKTNNLWSSPLALIREDGTFYMMGCGYCLGPNHLYNGAETKLAIAGAQAPYITSKTNIFDGLATGEELGIFVCPHCNNVIDKYAKHVPELLAMRREIHARKYE